jgi:hypothetical protein
MGAGWQVEWRVPASGHPHAHSPLLPPLQPLPLPDAASQVRWAWGACEGRVGGARRLQLPPPLACARLLTQHPLLHPSQQAAYKAWGYPFDYIKPSRFPEAMKKLYAGPVRRGTGRTGRRES